MKKENKSKQLSFKKYFFIIEMISLIFIIVLLSFFSLISFQSLTRAIIDKQKACLRTLTSEVEYLKDHSLNHLKNIDNDDKIFGFSKVAPEEFASIFTLDKNYVVKKIYKKNFNNIIFDGFSFEKLYLKDYITKNSGFSIFFTDILKSIDDKIVFYIVKLIDKDIYLVCEISIDHIIESISKQIETDKSLFLISNKNDYVIYNSNKSKEIFFIPELKLKYFVNIDSEYFICSHLVPVFFSNKFSLIVPVNFALKNIFANIPFYLFFIFISILIIFIKNILNNKNFLNPLLKTTNIITNWKISELENEVPKNFLGFKEVTNLIEVLIQKYFEFTSEFEQLQEAERTIRKMQKYLKNLIDSLPSAIISIDLEGNIIEWNKKAEEFTGIPKEDAISHKYNEIFPYLEKYKDNLRQVFNEEKLLRFNKEQLDDKGNRIVDVNIIPIIQNGLSGAAFRIDDMTELENLEKQIRQSQKMEIIGLLSGGIAHDFNNALSGIVSSISLIKEFIEENIAFKNPELIEYVDILENSSNRAKDIVQKLLTLSRKKEGKFVPMNLQSCLNDVERICKSTFEKSIELKFINPFSESIIFGDHNLIVQAILNLCINAAHAMTIMRKPDEKTGGILTVKLEIANDEDKLLKLIKQSKPEIQNQDFWKININDTGVGISQDIKNKIFEPFFTTKEAFYGSGIGLSTVKMIVEEHNGFIEFDSTEGKGTTFSIFLPILKLEKFYETPSEELQIKKGSGLVLVVDDEPLVRTITKTMLIKLGYTVLLASNGEQAITIFKKHMNNIKLVILDIAMPGKSGIEIFKEIKLLKNMTKILFVTGLKLEEKMSNFIEQESDGFLIKPFTINELSNSIYKIFNKK